MGFGRTQTETEMLMLGHLNKEPHHFLLLMRVLPHTVSNEGSERHKVNLSLQF